ncbi:acylneuraminate cytidylyltransferase family protein [Rhizobium wenxiniae]|uniref:acylneuraminate cytidylyltransferase family protein n=1 Tax=Rhizobium wenxiniae TaxID=1737357 RepID=UPI001C6E791A|nr:acylneuraminate cytidylyltransferase family protein [Rhizobium wenxiniae]MBW9089330.1 acylneuraminate cytidylyltransferase family protein [Rhizobium wenxiniae]
MHSDVVAIVPARRGSKGLPGKNTMNLAGKPLYRHSVDAALEAGISKVIISTDIDEIFDHKLPAQVSVLRRPESLAGDNVPMKDVLLDVFKHQQIGASTIVLLQPTSPLRRPRHVSEGIEKFLSAEWTLVMSVCEAPSSVLKWGTVESNKFIPLSEPRFCFANRQSLPAVFRPNGALYVFNSKQFVFDEGFNSDAIGPVLMTQAESLDIDTLEDFERCQMALQGDDFK